MPSDPVDPPKADPLAVGGHDVEPRSGAELIPHVMELRECSENDAEQYILDNGREQVERELQARWSA